MFNRSLRRAAAVAALTLFVCTPAGAAVPDEAAHKEIGERFAAAVRAGDSKAWTSLWDIEAMLDRVTDNVDAEPAKRAGFRQGVGNGFRTRFVERLSKSVGTTGSYKFLGLRMVDGQPRSVIRMAGDEGLNYHEIVAIPSADGKLKVVDMFIYVSGELITQSQRRMYMQVAFQQGNKKAVPETMQAMISLQERLKANDFAGVEASYNTLSEKAKRERLVQVTRIAAASRSGDEALHLKAIAEYATLFKGDATADLLSVDTLIAKKQFDAVFAALDRLEKQVGRDPYLDLLRARCLRDGGKQTDALKMVDRALSEEPDLFTAADTRLTWALEDKDYATAKKYLLHIERHHPTFRFGDLKDVDLFAGFVASPQYAEWQKERPASAE